MKRLATRIFLFCCLPLAISTVIAQQNSTESRDMLFRITAISKLKPDSIVALIKGGKKQGISLGSTGPISASFTEGLNRTSDEIGFGSVLRVDSNQSLVLIRPKDTSTTNVAKQIRKGDYIKLPIKIKKLPYHSIFFDLALMDIDFQNMDRKAIYQFDDLLFMDSKGFEDSLLKACALDVVDTYEYLKTDSSFKSLLIKNLIGRYNNKSVFDVMATCSARDIYTFLAFVKSYPGKYIGKSWKINETFATWVINNAPYSKVEFLDSIRLYRKTPSQLKAFVEKNKSLMIKEEYVRGWVSDAISAYNVGNEKEGEDLMQVSRLVLPLLNDNSSSGFYYYISAQIQQDKSNFKQAILYCDTASSYFEKDKNFEFYTESYFKKAYCFKRLLNYDAAILVYKNIEPFIKSNSWPIDPKEKTNQIAKYYRDYANALENKSDYLPAIEYYLKSTDLYQSIASYNSLTLAANNQLRLASIYSKQGEYVKSSLLYNQQLQTYQKLNDQKNEASVLDNIGFIESKLGNYRTAITNYQKAKKLHLFFQQYSSAGHSESSIAQCLWSLGQLDSAIEGHIRALSYRKQGNSLNGQGYSWSKLAALYSKVGKKDAALKSYDSASHFYTLAKDSIKLVSNLLDVGQVYQDDQQYKKAYDYFIRAHEVNSKRNNIEAMIESGMKIASATFHFDTASSRKYYELTLSNSKKIGNKTDELYSLLNLGLLKYKNYEISSGRKYFDQALTITIEQKNKSEEAYCYGRIAVALSDQMELDAALQNFEKSLHIYDSIAEKSSIPAILGQMASVYVSKGDFTKAMEYYKRQLGISREIKNDANVASALGNMSFLYVITGDLKLSAETADSSLAIYTRLKNSWQMANAYISIGNVKNKMNDYINSVRYYQLADSIYVLEKDDISRSTAKNNIGNVYFFQSDYDNALLYFAESEKLLAKLPYVNESLLLAKLNIGETYYHKKDYLKAEKILLEGYQLAKQKKVQRMLNSANVLLGKLYFDLKDYNKSQSFLLAALDASQKNNEIGQTIEAALFLAKNFSVLKNESKSLEMLSIAVNTSEKYNNNDYYWEALYELGLVYYNKHDFSAAIPYFKKGIEIIENISKNLFGGAEAKKIYNKDYRRVDLYNKVVASLVKLGKSEDALYYADKSNQQAIKEQTEKAGFVTSDKSKSEAIQKGNDLLKKQTAVEEAIAKEKSKPEQLQSKELIASLESIQQVAQKDYINYINGLVKKYPDLQAYFSKTNPADFKNNMRYIPDSTLAVLYIINEDQLYIFTATKQEIGIKSIELKTDLNKQADRFLAILRNAENTTGTGALTVRSTIKNNKGVKGDFKQEAAILYDILITPIKDQLIGKKKICIIPNGKLSNIPFQAIGKTENNSFRFLVEDYAIFYTNKIDIFSKPYEEAAITESFMALGNPDKSLPSAADEVQTLSKVFKNALVYTENDATEAKATDALSNYRYVHFATHGVLDFADFEKSYLIFAPEKNKEGDGKLTIEKINGLNIENCSMVTLSACETAVSKETVKGWYISPANSFLQNNVRTVVASLWQVDDKATSILMEAFYKNLLTMNKSEALRQAQATLSKIPAYAHPYFWSAFVLYGEWR